MNVQNRRHSRRLPTTGLAATVLLILSAIALAVARPQAMKQSASSYQTAMEHAQLGAKSTQLKTIQMHLHHVLNCLEGENGKDFDAAAGNPCNGKGALESLKQGTADWTRANNSIALARVGVALHDEKPAHFVAEAVLAILSESKH